MNLVSNSVREATGGSISLHAEGRGGGPEPPPPPPPPPPLQRAPRLSQFGSPGEQETPAPNSGKIRTANPTHPARPDVELLLPEVCMGPPCGRRYYHLQIRGHQYV